MIFSETPANETAALILAAGCSRRLGRPKQLITFQGRTLLGRTIDTVRQSGIEKTFVVTGAFRLAVEEILKQEQVIPVHNANWAQGIGSSIACGVGAISQDTSLSCVLLLVCDQPLLSTEHIHNLLGAKQQCGSSIVASSYSETFGIPVIFDRCYFPELTALSDSGAKEIISRNRCKTSFISFEKGSFDIDTEEEYEAFISLPRETTEDLWHTNLPLAGT